MPKLPITNPYREHQISRDQLNAFGKRVNDYFGAGVEYLASMHRKSIEIAGMGTAYTFEAELKIIGPWGEKFIGGKGNTAQDAVNNCIAYWEEDLHFMYP